MEQQLIATPADGIAALRMDVGKVMAAIEFNLGHEPLSDMSLQRITIPAGGGLQYTVPTLEGEVSMGALDCAIVYVQSARVYFSQPYGQDTAQRPDCSSRDAITGVGDPGGDCSRCKLSKFGSAGDGRSQACSERRRLFILRGESMLPQIVVMPPTSIRAAQRYMMTIAGSGLNYNEVITRITLERTKNMNGIAYSEARFLFLGRLTDAQVQVSTQFHELIKAMLTQEHTDGGVPF